MCFDKKMASKGPSESRPSVKTRSCTQKKDSKGKFAKQCGCISHDVFLNFVSVDSEDFNVKNPLWNIKNSNRVKKETLRGLIDTGLLPATCKYVCCVCVQNFEDLTCIKAKSKPDDSRPKSVINDSATTSRPTGIKPSTTSELDMNVITMPIDIMDTSVSDADSLTDISDSCSPVV